MNQTNVWVINYRFQLLKSSQFKRSYNIVKPHKYRFEFWFMTFTTFFFLDKVTYNDLYKFNFISTRNIKVSYKQII